MRFIAILFIVLSTVFSFTLPASAAFPVQSNFIPATGTITTSMTKCAPLPIPTQSAMQETDKTVKPRRNGKSYIMATLLSFFLGPTGIHRFYLGYTAQGVAQAFTLPLLFVLFIIIANTAVVGSTVSILLLILVAVILALCFWEISDFIRIITKDLKPKKGDYRKKTGVQ